jgi:hypothetical protein
VAHNRYWDPQTIYATQNGGKFDFIIEPAHKRAIPTQRAFWDYLMTSSKAWGMVVYVSNSNIIGSPEFAD